MDEHNELSTWYLMNERMVENRKRKLMIYAQKYIEPMFDTFPSLRFKIHLLLRQQGFIARTHPVYCIVVKERTIDCCSEWRIRFLTASMLMFFIQVEEGIPFLPYATDRFLKNQVTFFALSKGFSYDFLKTYPSECNRAIWDCDFSYSFCNVTCVNLFRKPCKIYDELQLKTFASAFELNCSKFSLIDNIDYKSELILQLSKARDIVIHD